MILRENKKDESSNGEDIEIDEEAIAKDLEKLDMSGYDSSVHKDKGASFFKILSIRYIKSYDRIFDKVQEKPVTEKTDKSSP